MKAAWRAAFDDLEAILRVFGPQPSKEIITQLIGELGEEDVWDVIRHAEKIGMIKSSEGLFDKRPLGLVWRLVEGFDRAKLELGAPA